MNSYNLKGRRAIVTGGAQGFGFAITKRFLESGAEVIIWDIDQKAIDEALKELSSEKCSYQIVDVTNFDDITKNIELSTKEKNIDIADVYKELAGSLESDDYFSGEEIQLILQKAIATLPQKQQIVFNMKYFDEMKYEEISEILKTSVGALKASYFHAVKKIEHYIKSKTD